MSMVRRSKQSAYQVNTASEITDKIELIPCRIHYSNAVCGHHDTDIDSVSHAVTRLKQYAQIHDKT